MSRLLRIYNQVEALNLWLDESDWMKVDVLLMIGRCSTTSQVPGIICCSQPPSGAPNVF
jgi:hypothetical protein